MHDIVLDVARYIASTELDQKMLVMGDDGGLHAWPDVDALQRCKALSVLGGDIRELPEGMQCPALKFFYINGEHLGALQIPGSFFEEIHIPDASLLPRDLKFENLERYEIVVGDVWDWSDKRETSRTLKLKLKTSIQAEEEVQKVLKRSERLFIDELKGIKIFVHELDIDDNLKHLKHLYIQNCDEIEHIVSSSMSALAFPILETILLKNMISLEQICYGQLPTASFGKLRVVEVERCQKLEFVFPSSVARGLSLLEVLEIKDCSIMRAIVVKEEGEIEDGDRILFPRLLKLVLHSLPKLLSFLSKGSLFMPVLHEQVRTRFNSSNDNPTCTARALLTHCRLRHCTYFDNLIYPGLVPRIESVGTVLDTLGRDGKVLWQINKHPTNYFEVSKFVILDCESCSNMRYLLSFSTARAMVQLQMLQVVKCKDMEEILTQDLGEEEIASPEELFPRLQNLLLQHLPILERFCIGRNIQFPSMKLLRIEHCPKLMTFIFNPVSSSMTARKEVDEMTTEEKPHNVMQPLFNEEVAIPKLELLTISHIDGTESMWHNLFIANSSCKLQQVNVQECANLKSFFPPTMMKVLSCLEHLIIDNCGSLTKVYGCGQIEMFALTFQQRQLEASVPQPLFVVDEGAFPKLEDLTVDLHPGVWPCQFLEELFCQVKVLWVGSGYSGSAFSPSAFVGRLHNLETLRVCSNFWEEIFPYEVLFGRGNHARSLTNLRELEFFENPMLTHLWKEVERLEEEKKGKEDMQPCPIFENLKILKVSECHKLSNLVPSTVSFQNLTNLEIFKCDGLIHLFTSSTARTLEKLKKLSVSECKSIMKIVGSGGEANHELWKK
ncbi:hypothetical protein CJ030_MR8G007351 [Morella rubra]|uniref:Disease resistance protein At4g27190-like leucine-rich repeats domain-containing protein n=1 Tax=Morella rubra TaxID=262757 RepID=A0A6A1URE8_9ROSI|nr:hypothetical protein CJ030_MR8G007351 [Morella rubra]